MKLGAVTYNVLKDWDLETVIKKLEEAGFEAVELRTEHKHGVETTIDAAARAAGAKPVREEQGEAAELRLDLRVPLAGRGGAAEERRGGQGLGRPGSRHWGVGGEGAAQRVSRGRFEGRDDHQYRELPA